MGTKKSGPAPSMKRSSSPADGAGVGAYARWSTRPLHVLVFLLPLVLLYELGSAVYLADPGTGTVERIRAERLLNDFFQIFDVGGVYLPGVVLVVTLVVWHILTGDRWRVRWGVLGWMLVECAAWTLPLLVLLHVVDRAFGPVGGAVAAAAATGGGGLADLPTGARITIALGAGLYEELLFRMVAIALIHLVLVDLMRAPDMAGRVAAVVIAAAAFALYHDVVGADGSFDWRRLSAFFAAGLYFGALYAGRGLGIVVGVHAMYDAVVLVLLGGGSS
jgi:membrane protease YdiL (CAAX protease family)